MRVNFASDFYRRRGYRREFRSEDHFYPFSSTEEITVRWRFSSLRKSRIMGPQEIAAIFGGAVKIAAAAAENRAILVHSDVVRWPNHTHTHTLVLGAKGALAWVFLLAAGLLSLAAMSLGLLRFLSRTCPYIFKKTDKIRTFKIILSWCFPRKTVFLSSFPLCPQCLAPSETQILFLLSSRHLWFTKATVCRICVTLRLPGPSARRDNVLASECEYPPFRYPPL